MSGRRNCQIMVTPWYSEAAQDTLAGLWLPVTASLSLEKLVLCTLGHGGFDFLVTENHNRLGLLLDVSWSLIHLTPSVVFNNPWLYFVSTRLLFFSELDCGVLCFSRSVNIFMSLFFTGCMAETRGRATAMTHLYVEGNVPNVSLPLFNNFYGVMSIARCVEGVSVKLFILLRMGTK